MPGVETLLGILSVAMTVISILGGQWREGKFFGSLRLVFANLATEFDLDDDQEIVTGIVKHQISSLIVSRHNKYVR